MKDQLRERYEGMSDDDLLDIVHHRAEQFTDDAKEVARAVLTERGIEVDELALLPASEVTAEDAAEKTPFSYITAAILAAIWVPVTIWVVEGIRDGDVGGAIFFVIAGILLTPLAIWIGGQLGPRAKRPK